MSLQQRYWYCQGAGAATTLRGVGSDEQPKLVWDAWVGTSVVHVCCARQAMSSRSLPHFCLPLPSSSIPLPGISLGLDHRLDTRSGWVMSAPVSSTATTTVFRPPHRVIGKVGWCVLQPGGWVEAVRAQTIRPVCHMHATSMSALGGGREFTSTGYESRPLPCHTFGDVPRCVCPNFCQLPRELALLLLQAPPLAASGRTVAALAH